MKIYYSIQNGGDGSAYPLFLSTEKLAQWDQDHLDEGWGESCVGELTVNATVFALPEVEVVEMLDEVGYWLHMTEDEAYEPWKDREEFLAMFFPDGLPTFEVRMGETHYYDIYVDGRRRGRRFGWNGVTEELETSEAGRAELEKRLNA